MGRRTSGQSEDESADVVHNAGIVADESRVGEITGRSRGTVATSKGCKGFRDGLLRTHPLNALLQLSLGAGLDGVALLL